MPTTIPGIASVARPPKTATVLVVDGGQPLPTLVKDVVARNGIGCERINAADHDETPEQLRLADAVVITDPELLHRSGNAEWVHQLLGGEGGVARAVLVLTPQHHHKPRAMRGLVSFVDPATVSQDEFWGRLATAIDMRPMLDRLNRELSSLERAGRRLNHHIHELDQEMQLASRLQHDLLPRQLPEIGRAHFATLYRPASWVSGDIYDVCRLDEDHVGFYIGDAVGHGVAAGLLTVFIKQSLWVKSIDGSDYEIITPAQTLTTLNDSLVAQELPNSQFVTACYCLLNIKTLELTMARGGHPYPFHLTHDGQMIELETPGGLLGLFPGEEYPEKTFQLSPGDKVVMYSDGVELLFAGDGPDHTSEERFRSLIQALRDRPAEEIIEGLVSSLDDAAGSLNPGDDLTVIVLEINE